MTLTHTIHDASPSSLCPPGATPRIPPSLLSGTVTPLLLVAALGCSGGVPVTPENAGAGGSTAEAAPPSLVGRWQSDCNPSPQADGSTQYARLDFDLTASTWSLEYVVFADAGCEVKLVTVAIAGDYALERPSDVVDGAWEARFGFDEKTIRPEVDGLRDALNGMEGCGASEFETGMAQDVLATGCPGFGQYPAATCSADHDLVKLDGDAIFFGARPADNNMCAPDRRPAALSPAANHRQ